MLPKSWTKSFMKLSFETAMKEQCSQGGYALLPYDLVTRYLRAGHPEMQVTGKSWVFPQIQALGFSSSASAEWAGGSFQDAKKKQSSGTHQAIGSSFPGSRSQCMADPAPGPWEPARVPRPRQHFYHANLNH